MKSVYGLALFVSISSGAFAEEQNNNLPCWRRPVSSREYCSQTRNSISVGGVGTFGSGASGAFGGFGAQLRLRHHGAPLYSSYSIHLNTIASSYVVVNYNALGYSNGQPTTEVQVLGDAFIGLTTGTLRQNCRVYFGASGTANIRVGNDVISGNNTTRLFVGPETGLICGIGDTTIAISPTVGIGTSASGQNFNEGVTEVFGGGVARVSIGDRVYVAARGLAPIPGARFAGSHGTPYQFQLLGDVRLSGRDAPEPYGNNAQSGLLLGLVFQTAENETSDAVRNARNFWSTAVSLTQEF